MANALKTVSAASVELAGRSSVDVDRSPVEVEQALVQRLERDPDFFVRAGARRLTDGGRRVRIGLRRDVRERIFPSGSVRIFPLSEGGARVTWQLREESKSWDPVPPRWAHLMHSLAAMMFLLVFVSRVTNPSGLAHWTDAILAALFLLLAIENGYFASRRRPKSLGLDASEIARVHEALHAALTGSEALPNEPGQLSLAAPSPAGELSLSDARP